MLAELVIRGSRPSNEPASLGEAATHRLELGQRREDVRLSTEIRLGEKLPAEQDRLLRGHWPVLGCAGEERKAGCDGPGGPVVILECPLRGLGCRAIAAMHLAVHEGERQPRPAERALVL